MATKTISVDMGAYERLCAARRSPNESFSQVIKRASWGPQHGSAAALLASCEGLPTLDDDTIARLERDQEFDAEPVDRWADD